MADELDLGGGVLVFQAPLWQTNALLALSGDDLSAITIPLLAASLHRALESAESLLAALDRYELRYVVPGHGPLHTPEEARRIGEEDLRYLEKLDAAAREATYEQLSPGYAL